MRQLFVIAEVLVSAATIALVFPAAPRRKAWRCRPDDRATAYERADACRLESWR